MYYTERLVWLRDCKSISQKEIADALHIKQQQYSRYERGINIMPVTYLIEICKYLNVNPDYILGFTEEIKPIYPEKVPTR